MALPSGVSGASGRPTATPRGSTAGVLSRPRWRAELHGRLSFVSATVRHLASERPDAGEHAVVVHYLNRGAQALAARDGQPVVRVDPRGEAPSEMATHGDVEPPVIVVGSRFRAGFPVLVRAHGRPPGPPGAPTDAHAMRSPRRRSAGPRAACASRA